MYENLSLYERALARFGDNCAIIASMEISGKITQEDAYQEIKNAFKELKKLRKKERRILGEHRYFYNESALIVVKRNPSM
jgi:hypothetical protein